MVKVWKIGSFLALILLVALSCTKETIIVDETDTMKELAAPIGFDFNMTIAVRISIQLPVTVSYSSSNRIIEIWSENSDGKPDKLIKTGTADNSGIYRESIIVPATSKKLFANCFAGWRSFVIQGQGLSLADGMVMVDYNIGYGKTPPKSKPGTLSASLNTVPATYRMLKTETDNVLKNGDFSVNQLESICNWSSPIESDGIWYATDEAKPFGSIISVEGNSFARINSPQYSSGGFTQLITATAGQIVSFSGDARGFDSQQDVYFFLIPRNQNGDPIEVYSFNLVNPGINWTAGTVAATMPEGAATCQVLFYKGSTGIVDFDNAEVQIFDTSSDRDGDGVLDSEDCYPEDAGQAFDDFYPAKDKPGTLAFEDPWPSQGDNDFNDLIIDYQISRISNARNKVVAINVFTQVRAIGGSIHNGFGFQIYVDPAQISGIKSEYESTGDVVSLNENGTETNQKWATFILCTDVFRIFTNPIDGNPTINTTMGYHYVLPSTKMFTIYLKDPLDPDQVGIEKINPFIFRQNDRSHEIHLLGFPPTDLADPELFGTGSDASDPSAGIYYQTKNGLPWAINIPVQFEYTIEGEEILKGFTGFQTWVLSGGMDKEDWYQDKQGYRNWEYIYRL